MKDAAGYIIILLVAIVGFIAGYVVGDKVGFNNGTTTTLDSVNSIVTRQVSDTAISSRFLIQSTDTVEFILNAKTIRMK